MKHLFLLFLLLISTAAAQFDPFGGEEEEKSGASAQLDTKSIAPGDSFKVLITLSHPDGWHAYYKNPGGVGLPVSFDWKLPEGYQVLNTQWPNPHIYKSGEVTFYTYEGDYSFVAEIKASDSIKTGESAALQITANWQICDANGCKPPESATLDLKLDVSNKTIRNESVAEAFAAADKHFPKANHSFQVSYEADQSKLVLTFVSKGGSKIPDAATYVDDAGVTNASAAQKLEKTADGFTLTIPRNEENKGDISSLSGILLAGKNSYLVRVGDVPASTESTPAAAEAGGHGITSQAPTAADIAAAAKLYNVNEKIDFVLLDGSKEKDPTLLTALGLIFIGGFLLNLMPCVFPVLGIKVLGFAEQAGQDPKKIKLHGLTFMAGLVVSMWVMAGVIYTLIFAFGRGVNWGEQLANPIFLAAMIVLLFLFGLNLAGVFEVGTSLTGAGSDLQAKKGYSGSFFSGVLTTLIATPCSGPFLGSVMAYTLKQPPLQGMIIFTVFALGISSPYVALAFFPKLINQLPRPGAWMETFKQLMSFALFATAAYFFRSFSKITGTGAGSWFLLAIVVIGLAAWAYGRFGKPFTPTKKRVVWGMVFPLFLTVGAFFMTKSATQERAPAPPLSGSAWYPGVVELNRSKGRIVWVDYTADW